MVNKHFPGEAITAESMGAALFIENRHWEQFEIVTANAIAKAFKG